MKKIVYVMNVDWNWIKQRPHFIAQELSKDNDVTVMYQYRYNRKGFQKRSAEGLHIKPVYVIPRGDRFSFLRKVNRSLKNAAIRRQVNKTAAQGMYLTFPDQVDAVPKNFKGKVIYDCMDNHPAFLDDPDQRKVMEQQEARLVQRADHVLVSSSKLMEVLIQRYGQACATKLTLVRNGYNGPIMELKTQQSKPEQKEYTIAYFGTISSWFNFSYLEKSLEQFPNLRYMLIGPADVPIPSVERMDYIGTVEHKELQTVTKDVQCLMMPFVVNEIIESVDPVKLYEYINFGKDILCVEYPEIARFAPYVHFYRDYSSFEEQLRQLMERHDVKYSAQERTQFLLDNNWNCRVDLIRPLLDN